MQKKRSLSAIEIFIIIGLLLVSGSLFWLQKQDIETARRDSARKVAINTLYANLEKSYYPSKKSYPKTLSLETLPNVNKDIFTDPDNQPIGSGLSTLRYEPNRCDGEKCQGYTLRALLEKEADFVKSSPR